MSSLCVICKRHFDDNTCKPLVLPCGHTMCRKCLLKFRGTQKICLFCGKSWAESNVESLPICFQLIPGETTEPVRTVWCITCRSSTCVENANLVNDECDLIVLGHKGFLLVIEYNNLCKKMLLKKSSHEKYIEEMTELCNTLKKEICNLDHLEKQCNEHLKTRDDSAERRMAVLADNIRVCKECLATKIAVTAFPLLSNIPSALQVNCYLITINFQSLLHNYCLPSCLLSR